MHLDGMRALTAQNVLILVARQITLLIGLGFVVTGLIVFASRAHFCIPIIDRLSVVTLTPAWNFLATSFTKNLEPGAAFQGRLVRLPLASFCTRKIGSNRARLEEAASSAIAPFRTLRIGLQRA
jgi:hypothetical protein